ncbi:MAG TPA: hypothetical protein VI685_25860, partial [Candidatus Angelobacter sp.]
MRPSGTGSHDSKSCNQLRKKADFFAPDLPNGTIIASAKRLSGLRCAGGFGKTVRAVFTVEILPRWLMALTVVSVVFGVFAVGLVLLLIYKSTLTMHEDDQLFLDDANSHMQEEQTELLVKVNRLTLPVRVFGVGSGVFLIVLVAMLIYQKLNEVQ